MEYGRRSISLDEHFVWNTSFWSIIDEPIIFNRNVYVFIQIIDNLITDKYSCIIGYRL